MTTSKQSKVEPLTGDCETCGARLGWVRMPRGGHSLACPTCEIKSLRAQLDEANHEVDRRGVVIGELQVKLAHAQLGCCDCNSSVARECAEKLDAARREVESLLTQQDVMRAKLDAANARIDRMEKAARAAVEYLSLTSYVGMSEQARTARNALVIALTAYRDEGEG